MIVKKTILDTIRHYARVMAFVFGMGIGAIMLQFVLVRGDLPVQPSPVLDVVKQEAPATSTIKFARSAPMRLTIPRLSLDVAFEAPLKLNADKTVAVPTTYDKVGWYEGGSTPGEVGPAVILGHVDSYQGAAVFYHLGQLRYGDEIAVTREDGTTAVFEVESLKRYERKDFPTHDVYGGTDEPVLRLVTCSGIFNKGKQEYSHNLVVYAHLKK